jgi:hypothetical protein
MTDLNHYVSGERAPGKSGRFADVFNPATGAAEKRVPLATTEEVGEVVAIAKAAWPAWAKTPPLLPFVAATGAAREAPSDGRPLAAFSRSRNTRLIAGQIDRSLQADRFEIQPARPYPDDYFETVEQAQRERDSGFERPLAATRQRI